MATRIVNESEQGHLPSLPELQVIRFNWQAWLSGILTLAFLCTILWKINEFGFVSAFSTLPTSSIFWLAFAGYYLALPSSEWLIFRNLWKLPFAGFGALLRKLVSNEVLLGYSGEAFFYTWARQHCRFVAAPFGAIKDVSILSALAGNIATLVMMMIAWPMIGHVAPQFHGKTVLLSMGAIIAVSIAILAFKSRIFSLPGKDLRWIFAVHICRLIITTLLSGVMWHAALPDVSLVWLVLLATLQLIVTRLPFIPNKELVFASLAIFMIGQHSAIGALIAMIATTILAIHLIFGAVLVANDLLEATKG